jgi:hypothetical protein
LGWQFNPVTVFGFEIPPQAYLGCLVIVLLFPQQQTLIAMVLLFVIYRWHMQSKNRAPAPAGVTSHIRRQ